MQFTTTILFAILATIAASVPTPTLQARACTTITPHSMQSLLSTDPTIGYTNHGIKGTGENGFTIFQDNTEASNRYDMKQFIDFQVPAGSYGCQLHVTDAATTINYSKLSGSQKMADPGMASVKVMSLHPNAMPIYPSYNDVMTMDPSLVSASAFGTFSIKNGTQPKAINSEACPPAMNGEDGHLQFVFELEGNDLSHTRYFSMVQRGAAAVGGLNGVYMTFNC